MKILEQRTLPYCGKLRFFEIGREESNSHGRYFAYNRTLGYLGEHSKSVEELHSNVIKDISNLLINQSTSFVRDVKNIVQEFIKSKYSQTQASENKSEEENK